jgi:hypothetical protein
VAAWQSNAPPQGHVRVVVEANTPRQGPIRIMIDNMEWLDEEDSRPRLERISEQLAFTAGTMIAAEADDPEQIDRILDGFQALVRDNARRMAKLRRDNARREQ